MSGPSNRSVAIISGLLTLLVLGGATLAVGFRNGWVHVASAAPRPNAVTPRAQPSDRDGSRAVTASREIVPSAVPGADSDQSEIAVYRAKLEEAYRALDDAYGQVRSLQTAQIASRGVGDRAFTASDDERHERGPRHRESDDD